MREINVIKKEKILRLPSWIKFPISKASEFERIQTLIKKSNIHTICEEARCPNRAECYASGTATFLLGGSICSRSCAFCQVNKGRPSSINIDECTQVAQAVKVLNLKYVVLTSVARDDLPDHGANLFITTIDEIRKIDSRALATIGVLSNPDQKNIKIGKAGRSRWLGRRPHTRGVVKNPVDHPHGGGEGKSAGGRHPVSPTGQSAKGLKTRDNKRTDKFIIRRRKKKRA